MHTCASASGGQRHQIPHRTELQAVMSHLLCVRETKLRSFARTLGTLQHEPSLLLHCLMGAIFLGNLDSLGGGAYL